MYPEIIKWLESHLLACPFRSIFGFDCPGCGFQRSCIALLKGNMGQSFSLYPATIPIIIVAIVLLLNSRYKFDSNTKITKTLFYFTGTVIGIAYINKIFLLYLHR